MSPAAPAAQRDSTTPSTLLFATGLKPFASCPYTFTSYFSSASNLSFISPPLLIFSRRVATSCLVVATVLFTYTIHIAIIYVATLPDDLTNSLNVNSSNTRTRVLPFHFRRI
ncbi:hypothetical protein F5Y06DRAFT_210008 [Hypoxylon sp. FL0890]|nr:hypothetical protein F5Y06DRAFT_210008 [Hypoxylon sp. FL0890]